MFAQRTSEASAVTLSSSGAIGEAPERSCKSRRRNSRDRLRYSLALSVQEPSAGPWPISAMARRSPFESDSSELTPSMRKFLLFIPRKSAASAVTSTRTTGSRNPRLSANMTGFHRSAGNETHPATAAGPSTPYRPPRCRSSPPIPSDFGGTPPQCPRTTYWPYLKVKGIPSCEKTKQHAWAETR